MEFKTFNEELDSPQEKRVEKIKFDKVGNIYWAKITRDLTDNENLKSRSTFEQFIFVVEDDKHESLIFWPVYTQRNTINTLTMYAISSILKGNNKWDEGLNALETRERLIGCLIPIEVEMYNDKPYIKCSFDKLKKEIWKNDNNEEKKKELKDIETQILTAMQEANKG